MYLYVCVCRKGYVKKNVLSIINFFLCILFWVGGEAFGAFVSSASNSIVQHYSRNLQWLGNLYSNVLCKFIFVSHWSIQTVSYHVSKCVKSHYTSWILKFYHLTWLEMVLFSFLHKPWVITLKWLLYLLCHGNCIFRLNDKSNPISRSVTYIQ